MERRNCTSGLVSDRKGEESAELKEQAMDWEGRGNEAERGTEQEWDGNQIQDK